MHLTIYTAVLLASFSQQANLRSQVDTSCHRKCYRRAVRALVQYRDLTAKNWLVLTGAHDLLALEPDRVAHTVAKVFLHPDFNLDTFDSDVALLRLNTPVTWSSTVSPVCLPPPDYEFQSTTQCVITGWGVAGQLLVCFFLITSSLGRVRSTVSTVCLFA